MALEPTIAYADDDIEDLELFAEAVSQVNPLFKVQSFSEGEQLLEYLKQCTDDRLPCLILLDYNMPKMSGIELLQMIAADGRFGIIPKVILSTSISPATKEQALDNGATLFFNKPRSIAEVYKLATELMAFCHSAESNSPGD
jgi:CheY-like chemotaxis protein